MSGWQTEQDGAPRVEHVQRAVRKGNGGEAEGYKSVARRDRLVAGSRGGWMGARWDATESRGDRERERQTESETERGKGHSPAPLRVIAGAS